MPICPSCKAEVGLLLVETAGSYGYSCPGCHKVWRTLKSETEKASWPEGQMVRVYQQEGR